MSAELQDKIESEVAQNDEDKNKLKAWQIVLIVVVGFVVLAVLVYVLYLRYLKLTTQSSAVNVFDDFSNLTNISSPSDITKKYETMILHYKDFCAYLKNRLGSLDGATSKEKYDTINHFYNLIVENDEQVGGRDGNIFKLPKQTDKNLDIKLNTNQLMMFIHNIYLIDTGIRSDENSVYRNGLFNQLIIKILKYAPIPKDPMILVWDTVLESIKSMKNKGNITNEKLNSISTFLLNQTNDDLIELYNTQSLQKKIS